MDVGSAGRDVDILLNMSCILRAMDADSPASPSTAFSGASPPSVPNAPVAGGTGSWDVLSLSMFSCEALTIHDVGGHCGFVSFCIVTRAEMFLNFSIAVRPDVAVSADVDDAVLDACGETGGDAGAWLGGDALVLENMVVGFPLLRERTRRE